MPLLGWDLRHCGTSAAAPDTAYQAGRSALLAAVAAGQPARTEWLYEDSADPGNDRNRRPWRPRWAWGRARDPGASATTRFNP